MRHRVRGRKLGRNPSHRKAMFRNMACSLIRSVRTDDDASNKPKIPGRIVTTLPKAKELRPLVEKLVTIARKATEHKERAAEFATSADRNSDEWKQWRQSEQWNQWNQAIAPAVTYRRRAFSMLRDRDAVDILFNELAERFEDRDGGYTRVVQLADVRLGDAGKQALIEFVGERDRAPSERSAPVISDEAEPAAETEDTGESEASADESDSASESAKQETEASAPEDEDEASSETKDEVTT